MRQTSSPGVPARQALARSPSGSRHVEGNRSSAKSPLKGIAARNTRTVSRPMKLSDSSTQVAVAETANTKGNRPSESCTSAAAPRPSKRRTKSDAPSQTARDAQAWRRVPPERSTAFSAESKLSLSSPFIICSAASASHEQTADHNGTNAASGSSPDASSTSTFLARSSSPAVAPSSGWSEGSAIPSAICPGPPPSSTATSLWPPSAARSNAISPCAF
mmetsp:Transcript_105773/g.266224  ORF Transcript_105773/g.266224 Transcript_105773/m.266224 type:complete len:218 (+) Transcript_105773:149-802(+)